jgi:hypothetical protein
MICLYFARYCTRDIARDFKRDFDRDLVVSSTRVQKI